MPTAAERAFILHGGDQPGADEVGKIIIEFERDTGIDLGGVRITSFGGGAGEPNERVAQILVRRLEREGEISAGALERTIVRTITLNGTRRVMAVVRAKEQHPPSAAHGVPARRSPSPAGRPDPVLPQGGPRPSRPRRVRLPLLPLGRRHWVEALIAEHLEKIDEGGSAAAWRPGWAELSSRPAVSFVADARDGDVRQFQDVLIMVSVLPETDPDRIRQLMPGGYTTRVNEIAEAAGLTRAAQRTDVAHWLVCARDKWRAVHLGYFIFPEGPSLLPWDALPPDQQRKVEWLC